MTYTQDYPEASTADWVELHRRPELVQAVSQWQGTELALQGQLRKTYAPALVRLAIQLVDARRRARLKFEQADQMWFDRQGVEQSSSEAVARYKATRLIAAAGAKGQPLLDLCSGAGSDAIAQAHGVPVIAVDARELAGWWLHQNALLAGVADRIEFQQGRVQDRSLEGTLLHIDPDRRAGGADRVQRLEGYEPPLEWLQQLTTRAAGGAIKVGPASNFGGKFEGTEIELISLRGECREATIWFGELAGADPCRATVLAATESHQTATLAGHPLSARAEVCPLREYLYDVDPAVVRAGLVDVLCQKLGLDRLDLAEEYLTGSQLAVSPFVTPFRVLAELPNNVKELRRQLRQGGFGAMEIKCRHLSVSVEQLARTLPRSGDRSGVIFFARLAGRSQIVLAERVQRTESHYR